MNCAFRASPFVHNLFPNPALVGILSNGRLASSGLMREDEYLLQLETISGAQLVSILPSRRPSFSYHSLLVIIIRTILLLYGIHRRS